MKLYILSVVVFLSLQISKAQVSSYYTISFENAVHHEAFIEAEFKYLKNEEVIFRMSRSSPGRYALHEFAKNVFDVKATNSKGNPLTITRPDPYSWKTSGHDGSIKISYRLFANHGDGTYAQVDETHAHLNIPATFMYVPELEDKEIEITFIPRQDLNWKVATQLKHLKENTYYAKNLQYFMDSPTELSNFMKRSFTLDDAKINLVVHHRGSESDMDAYFDQVKEVVLQEKLVYGELPAFDYGEYTFIACYLPNVDGDGMEHRNSTICTSSSGLSDKGSLGKIRTLAHEFFHAWNVERIRPKSLEPFNFEKANMSGELWFGEGFTTYYGALTLCRSDIMDAEAYVKYLTPSFNYVWNSSGRLFYNPIEMSYQAPFQDAAESVDQTNSRNTFISYYNYGHMIGLALDLSLREKGLNLDDYLKTVWQKFGKPEKSYTNEDLEKSLAAYAGKDFANAFFGAYIYDRKMPDYQRLLGSVGITLESNKDNPYYGMYFRDKTIREYPSFHSPAYAAGLTKGDIIESIEEVSVLSDEQLNELLATYSPGDKITISYNRYGELFHTTLVVGSNPNYRLSLSESSGIKPDIDQQRNRDMWLSGRE